MFKRKKTERETQSKTDDSSSQKIDVSNAPQVKNEGASNVSLEHLKKINSLLKYVTEMDYIKDMLLGVNKQAGMIENVASSSEEMTASIEDISNFVQDSSSKANNSIQIATKSIQEIERAFEDITASFEASKEVQKIVEGVKKEAEKINEMVTIIKGVADQTNLLALNASIEAARAGEHGRGFAVVADEIKKLAENTKQQVAYIQNTVNQLSSDINKTNEAMSASNLTFEKGKLSLTLAVKNMDIVQEDLSAISGAFVEISANIEEQTAASQEMSSSIMVINDETKTLHKETERTGRAINSVSTMIEEIRLELIGASTEIDMGTQIEVCICDHLMWRWRVYNMILGYEKLTDAQVGTHHTCRLGRWCDATEFPNDAMCAEVASMEKPHESLHELAKKAIKAYNSGNHDAAEKILPEIDRVSNEVVEHLKKLKRLSKK